MIRFLVLAALLFATSAFAQTAGPVAADIEAIADAARARGMTVIVMAPPAPAAAPAMMDTMRAERFLAARARLRDILASAGTLPEAAWLTLKRINALGRLAGDPFDFWWLVRGLATAALGAFLGWLALRPVVRWLARLAREMVPRAPRGAADRAARLLLRASIAIALAAAIFGIALLVAVVLDSGFEPTRRIIFECLLAFLIYRLLRFGVSWNLTAYDAPDLRFVGFSDRQAVAVHRSWCRLVALVLVALVPLRFLLVEGRPASTGGTAYGALTPEHAALLVVLATFVATLAVVWLVVRNWRAAQCLLRPVPDENGMRPPAHPLREALARAVPGLLIGYAVFAFLAFILRLGLDQPAPATTVVAPFVIGYAALVVYGLALIALQAFYEGRERRFHERVARDRAAAIAEARAARARLRDDEDMEFGVGMPPDDEDADAVVPPAIVEGPAPEYHPVLRGFLEQAALAVVLIVALGELGRLWGVPVGEDGNLYAGLLDTVLAVALAWIAYRAITAAIDRRLAEEVGPEVDDDALGNEGGAGASRLATLLPILRWVLIAFVLVAAVIAVLSRFGVDIGPLLASAGVVGIAVGFGAQKLIQDIFSGAFFLLDDAFRKGEYIDVEGTKGTVEKISIRSFQLRHHLGALHTLPFGEIRKLTNFSRDWVLMKLPLRVTYDTDVEQVRKLIKKLGQQLLEHPEVGHTFMQPLKSQGVYRMEDSAMIIRVKFMTKPGEQFVTRKVVYAAIQELFAREGIRFAHKEVTVRLADGEASALSEEQKRAVTAAAREVIDAEEAAASRPTGADR